MTTWPYSWRDAPQAITDCSRCVEPSQQRDQAHARHDGSAETDCNVLLRKHQQEDHL